MLSRKLLLVSLMAGLSVAFAHQARAEDEDDLAHVGAGGGWRPHFTVKVPRDKMKAAYPKGATVTGKAALDCTAADGGKLVDCKVAQENPAGQGFGQAALSVVGYERIKATDDAGAATTGRPVRTFFEFLGPGDANPNWLRKPTGQEIANVFPKKAIEDGVGGKATIGCQVTTEGFLQNCKVLYESPKDYNFGAAGLQLTPQLRMTPKMRGGKAVPGGTVAIPINWEAPSPSSMMTSTTVVLDPPWTIVPTQAEVNAAWPKEAAGLASGQAALRCGLDRSGRLRGCDVISESPRGKGFGKAALSLSKSFGVTFAPEDAKTARTFKIDVPFRFRDPATPDTRKLTKPRWIRTLSPEGMASVYPEAAVKAGVRTGQGAATCTVTATGELTSCQAARETPAGLDFGAAAIKAAGIMRMNPWTKEGDSVDGLVITLPITFTLENDEPAAAGAAKPGP
ncbi:TonB family protein [Caulobacter segnis]|uniref:TonB family protein n=1 Tax=Caulobacter segnis TaxID=88688 RepID=UPI001CC14ADE|nr:TonB family protein [Caulobacter segnis]UAL10402.1 energy transducer TonB [Caulobacter segnis]